MSLEDAPGTRRTSYRALFGLLDTGISSVGNLAVSLLAARSMSVADFGILTIVMISLLIATGVSKALHGDTLVLKVAANSPERHRLEAKSSLNSCALLGVAASIILAAGSTTVSWLPFQAKHDLSSLLLTCAVVTPLLLLQDHYRWIEYARWSPGAALINNSLWTSASILAMIALTLYDRGGVSPSQAILAWGVSTVPAIIFAGFHSGLLPRIGWPLWLRRNRVLASKLVQDFSLLQASTQGALVLLAALSSATEIGLLRKAQVFLSPVNVATNGLMSVLQPILVRQWVARGYKGVVNITGLVAGVGALLTVVYGLLITAVPSPLATRLVGGGWAEAQAYIAPLLIQATMGLVGGCAGLSLRVMGKVGTQIKVRWLMAPASILAVAVGAVLSGPLAAAWALAAVNAIAAIAWATLLVRERLERAPSGALVAEDRLD